MAFGEFKEVAEKTRQPRESLSDELKNMIKKSNKEKKSLQYAKKILICGDNGTGKTTLALDLLCYNLKEDEMVIYVDVDGSGAEVITTFFEDLWFDDNIKHITPYAEKTVELNNGKTAEVKDEETIVTNTIAVSSAIKELMSEGIKIKGVIIDGVSFLLECCESRMRLEKGLGVDQGVNTSMWKIRSQFFREFTSPYMALPIPVIFVAHDDFIRDPKSDKDLSAVKQRLHDECSVRLETYKEEDGNVINYCTIIKKDRSVPFNVGRNFVFLTINISEEIREKEDLFIDEFGEDCSNSLIKNIFKIFKKNPKNKKQK